MTAPIIQSPQDLFNIVEYQLQELLGVYEIISETKNVLATAPAIWIVPPQVPANRQMKAESGIEAIIQRTPRLFPQQYLGNETRFEQRWQVILTQYKTTDTIQEASQRLVTYLNNAEVEVTPQIQTEQGLTYEQARINVPEYISLKAKA